MGSAYGGRRGFSLIEILVVIVIIGVVASVAVMSLGLIGDDRELRTEARRLVSLVELAHDEAVMQGRDFGLEIMTQRYRFVEYDAFTGQWTELFDETLRPRDLPEDAEFILYIDDQDVVLDPNPMAFDEEGEDEINARPLESYSPHVLIYSSGETTRFELHLLRPSLDQEVVVRSDVTGALEIVTDDE